MQPIQAITGLALATGQLACHGQAVQIDATTTGGVADQRLWNSAARPEALRPHSRDAYDTALPTGTTRLTPPEMLRDASTLPPLRRSISMVLDALAPSSGPADTPSLSQHRVHRELCPQREWP